MIGLLCFVLAVLASPFKSMLRLEAENAVAQASVVLPRNKSLLGVRQHEQHIPRRLPSIHLLLATCAYRKRTGRRCLLSRKRRGRSPDSPLAPATGAPKRSVALSPTPIGCGQSNIEMKGATRTSRWA